MLDTNVILDIWLARDPYWIESARLLARVESGELTGYICPTTINTLHYLGKKVLGEQKIRELIKRLLDICDVGNISSKVFRLALASRVRDFDDAVIEAVSIDNQVDLIATRNTKDFKKSKIPASEPSQIAYAK